MSTARSDDSLPVVDPGIGPSASPHPRRRRRVLVVLLVARAIVFAIAVWGARGCSPTSAGPAEGDPTTTARDMTQIVALGRLQPLDGVVEVGAPTSSGGVPKIGERLVDDGVRVRAGDPLFTLDTCPQLDAIERAAAQAVAVAETNVDRARQDVRGGRKESQAALEAARVAATQAERDHARAQTLLRSGALSPEQAERKASTASQTAAELQRAQANARRWSSAVDVRVAQANLAAAQAERQRAQVELETCTVRAPSDGTVLSVEIQAGERAASGTLLRLGDLEHMEAELEVFEESVPRLAVGAPVSLESRVLGNAPLHGEIRRIGSEIGRQALIGSDPAANTDARVIRAWVELDADSSRRAAKLVGLEVVAHIEVGTPSS